MSIPEYKLRGHRKPVLSLAHSSHSLSPQPCSSSSPTIVPPCCLLSGSEDGTMRLWDLRSDKACLCIIAPSNINSESSDTFHASVEITSVAFHPIWGTQNDDLITTSLTGKSYVENNEKKKERTFLHPFTVYMSVGSNVYGYDLRNTSSPIVKSFDYNVSSYLQNRDEINTISFDAKSIHKKNNTNLHNSRVHLAAADDSGQVRITSHATTKQSPVSNLESLNKLSNHKLSTSSCILQHAENDPSTTLVTCMDFRPRSKDLDIATGGTDCTIHLWDINRPRRPSSTFHVHQDDTGANQICNPPIVHSMSWSPSGRLLACGLGDGSSIILRADGRKLVEACRIRDAHGGAVASVLFPQFGTNQSFHLSAEDRLLVTAGNDGAILLWDLEAPIAGDNAINPSLMLNQELHHSGKDNGGRESDNISNGLSVLSVTSPRPKIIFGIPHQHKPNWLVSNRASDHVLPSSLFVADTSSDITVYSVPWR